MPVIDTTAAASTAGVSASYTDRTPKSELDSDSFMKLFVAQLKYQSADSSMDSAQMIEQLSTMSQMQSMQTMTSAMESMNSNTAMASSLDLLKKNVTWIDANGEQHTGEVSSVNIVSGQPVMLTDQNLGFSLNQMTSVSA